MKSKKNERYCGGFYPGEKEKKYKIGDVVKLKWVDFPHGVVKEVDDKNVTVKFIVCGDPCYFTSPISSGGFEKTTDLEKTL